MDAEMEESRVNLTQVVVGRKIMEVRADRNQQMQLVLDDGRVITLHELGDCCAYATIRGWLVNGRAPDNMITSVTTNEDYTEWFILSEAAEVMRFDVDWSEGSGYYMYGFSIKVEEDKS